MCRFRILGFFLLIPWGMQAQEPNSVNITIISEAAEISSDPQDFEKVIREEIEVLLRNRFEVAIKSLYANLDPDKIQANIDQAFQDPQTDIIISIGSVSSAILARQEDYPKPCIASIILDQKLQGIPGNQQGGSGVKNFTFLESPFDIKRDLETLYRVQAFDRVGLLAPAYIRNLLPFPMDEYFAQQLSPLGLSFDFIPYEENGGGALAEIPEDVEAIYILPSTADISDQAERNLISQINERGLLSAGLLGDDWLDKGSLLGYNSTKNLQLIPRRIALNVLKIAEGQSAADLPVKVPTYTETLLINMATARQIEKFPDFDLMAQAILLNLNEVETDRSLSLEGVLAEALRANLEVLIAEKDVDLADKDLSISKTDLLPQVVGSSTINLIDPNSSQNSFGSQGRVNWSAAANLSQVILSEPTLANIAIQRYLLEGQKYALQEQQLEIIQRTSETYLSVLQAQTNLRVRQDNVLVTKENYDIAQAKEAVGYSGATDINRFKAELAQNNIALNNAQAQYKQSQYALNQLLNRPVDEEFVITEDNFQTPMERVIDPRILNLINNYGDLRKYGDFLVDESKRRLPE
ncbi:MAG: TolC family protein, partial [Bacteroidota bacterium]